MVIDGNGNASEFEGSTFDISSGAYLCVGSGYYEVDSDDEYFYALFSD